MQANKEYMLAKKHPFKCCLAAKHPQHNKLRVTNTRKKPVNLFYGNKRASTSALAPILAPLQKFLFLYNL